VAPRTHPNKAEASLRVRPAGLLPGQLLMLPGVIVGPQERDSTLYRARSNDSIQNCPLVSMNSPPVKEPTQGRAMESSEEAQTKVQYQHCILLRLPKTATSANHINQLAS
jgi:hypothetical protein